MAEQTSPREAIFNPPPLTEHRWLQKLVGEWTYEAGSPGDNGEPTDTLTGTETVRSLGDLWIIAEGTGLTPDGSPATSVMTLGFDPRKGRFVGTWVGSMMNHLWVYNGELDESERILSLLSEGPDMTGGNGTKQYRDVIEFVSDDHRVLRGQILGDDGKWTEFMTAHYRRQ